MLQDFPQRPKRDFVLHAQSTKRLGGGASHIRVVVLQEFPQRLECFLVLALPSCSADYRVIVQIEQREKPLQGK